MITNNTFTEIGDEALIKSGEIVLGLVTLTSYADSVIGETANRYFERLFRYSLNGGVIYSDWMELNNSNVSDIETDPISPFLVEYLYKRSGTDDTGELIFNNVILNGEFVALSCPELYQSSIFAEYFGCYDTKVIEWCLNVADKLYRNGIVAEYIERAKSENLSDDEDYIVFWKSISCFFAMLYNLSLKLSQFSYDKKMLIDFLRNRGLFVSIKDDISLLLYLMNNYNREMRKRGTIDVFSYSDDYVGEFYRIIESTPSSAIIIYPKAIFSGWIVDRNSPLYRGNYLDNDFVVGFKLDESQDYIDEYISGTASLSTDSIRGVTKDIIVGGIDTVISNEFSVNKDMSYEMTAWVNLPTGKTISIHADTYNSYGIGQRLSSIVDNHVIDGDLLVDGDYPRDDYWYFIRHIIYKEGVTLKSTDENESHVGIDAKFLDSGEGRLKFSISIGEGVKIHNVKARVLTRPSSVVRMPNAIQVYAVNNNKTYTETIVMGTKRYYDLEDDIKYYLIPYKNTLMINWL